ncbi:MAG: DUF99 family protein, partial [Candidatus Altiarchaeales archaeon]|nr:DUF99 family protein [Candidatus Altiarchaeales archaeon]
MSNTSLKALFALLTIVATKFYRIKPEVRILGLDDGPFKQNDKKVLVVGVVFRGGSFLDGVVSTKVRVDG